MGLLYNNYSWLLNAAQDKEEEENLSAPKILLLGAIVHIGHEKHTPGVAR